MHIHKRCMCQSHLCSTTEKWMHTSRRQRCYYMSLLSASVSWDAPSTTAPLQRKGWRCVNQQKFAQDENSWQITEERSVDWNTRRQQSSPHVFPYSQYNNNLNEMFSLAFSLTYQFSHQSPATPVSAGHLEKAKSWTSWNRNGSCNAWCFQNDKTNQLSETIFCGSHREIKKCANYDFLFSLQ